MAMRANLQFAADQSSRNDRIANTVTQVQRIKNARWVLMKDTGSDETKTVPAPADRIPAVRLVPCGMTPRNETSSADHVYVLVKVPSWALDISCRIRATVDVRSYFRSTGRSTPRKSNGVSPLTHPWLVLG
jgi:hypothetical protein